jgi:hypothetical protein
MPLKIKISTFSKGWSHGDNNKIGMKIASKMNYCSYKVAINESEK